MYGPRNSELSTCLFQFSHETRQTMLLYAYFTPKVDFKRKFNHQSFLYEWRLTARTIRKFRIGLSIRIESRIGRTIRNRIESRSFAGPYPYCVGGDVKHCSIQSNPQGQQWPTTSWPVEKITMRGHMGVTLRSSTTTSRWRWHVLSYFACTYFCLNCGGDWEISSSVNLSQNYDKFHVVFGSYDVGSWVVQRMCSNGWLTVKDDRQRFLWKVSKKQVRTFYYNANTCG